MYSQRRCTAIDCSRSRYPQAILTICQKSPNAIIGQTRFFSIDVHEFATSTEPRHASRVSASPDLPVAIQGDRAKFLSAQSIAFMPRAPAALFRIHFIEAMIGSHPKPPLLVPRSEEHTSELQ